MSTTDPEDDGRDMNPLVPAWEATQGTIEGEKATEEYTPTTEQVRQFWASEGRYIPAAKNYGITAGRAEFDRWLAAHDADLTARLAAALAANAEMKTMYQELNTLQDAVVEEHAELESRLAAAEQTIEDALVASRASSVPLGMPEASFYRRVLRESERILSAYRPVAAHPTTEGKTEVSTRRLAVLFLSQPMTRRIDIAKRFGVWDEADETIPRDELSPLILSRIRVAGLIDRLASELAAHPEVESK